MRKNTFDKLDLAAQRIADRLIYLSQNVDIKTYAKPYEHVKQFIMDNRKHFTADMYGMVKLENVCKTARQVNYLTNEVLHRLRRAKFFKKNIAVDTKQMEFEF